MSRIEFSKEQKDLLVQKLTRYVSKEFDHEISGFEATFFLDFIAEELGPYFYNQGLHDAKAVFELRIETIGEAIYEIEKPTKA